LLFLASVAAGIFLYRALLVPRTPAVKIDPAGSSAGG
jgi:hypothetical protein